MNIYNAISRSNAIQKGLTNTFEMCIRESKVIQKGLPNASYITICNLEQQWENQNIHERSRAINALLIPKIWQKCNNLLYIHKMVAATIHNPHSVSYGSTSTRQQGESLSLAKKSLLRRASPISNAIPPQEKIPWLRTSSGPQPPYACKQELMYSRTAETILGNKGASWWP